MRSTLLKRDCGCQSPGEKVLAELGGSPLEWVVGFVMREIYLGEFGIPIDTAAVDTIRVHPKFQRSGIAHMLLDEYKSHAREAGVKRLDTLV
jgi:ribosomal protein S18 acetylase RimI-like enzyme